MYINYFKNEITNELFVSHLPRNDKPVGVDGWRYATEAEIEAYRSKWSAEEILQREG